LNNCGICSGPAFINHDKLGPLCRPCALDLIQQAIGRPAAPVIDLEAERNKRRPTSSKRYASVKLAIIVHEDDKWLVKTEDGSRTLGTHDNKRDAEIQLYAIHKSQEREKKKKHKRKKGSMSFEERYVKEAAMSCLGCGRKKGTNEGQCPKKDGPECKEYLREKTRGAIDIGDETPRN